MRKLYLFAALTILLIPALGADKSPFDGTWKTNMNNVQFPTKPDVYVLKDGMYTCKTCVPPYTIKADGTDQKVTGHPYFDTIAIKVVNDHEIEETDKKDGKVVGNGKTVLSPDGNTLSFEFTDSSNTNGGPPVTGKGEATRVAKGPAGSSPISGSWRMKKMSSISDNAITYTYKTNGDEITMTNGTGQTYTAKMDGTEAPMKGDPGVTSVSVKRTGKNSFEETDKRNGKVLGVFKATVSADGKTLNGVYEDKEHGTSAKFTATKQE
jgi:hypothetical protein